MSTKVIKYISVCLLVLAFGVFGTGIAKATLTATATALTSDGALTLTGAATSVWSLSTGALTINSANTSALTLDSGTTGAVNLGTGASAKTITVGNAASTEAEINALLVDINGGATGITVDSAGTLSLDAATASNLTVTGSGENLTIAAAGGGAQVLALSSAGTGAGALTITTTAGGLDISVTGTADTEDLDITTVGTTTEMRLTSASTTADSIAIQAITTTAGIDIDSGTGGVAINTATTGPINIDTGTTGVINLGTGASAKTITIGNAASTEAEINALLIDINGGATGITVDSAGEISLDAAAASNFTTTGAGIDITIDATAGSVVVDSGEAAANAILLQATGGTTATAHLTSNGTGASAVDIDATGTGGDVDIDANDAIDLLAGGVFSIDGTGASNVSATSGNLTLSTITTGALILSSAGNTTLDVATGGLLSIDVAAPGIEVATANNISVAASDSAGVVAQTLVIELTGAEDDEDDFTVRAVGANGDLLLTSGDDLLIDTVGLLELNSSAGVISIGNDAVAQNINIGGAGARTVTIGNATTTTAVAFDTGTGGYDFDFVAGAELDITSAASTVVAGVLDINVDSNVTGGFEAINLALTVNDLAATADDFDALSITLTASDADADVFGIRLVAADGAGIAGSYEAGIFIDNADLTAGSMPSAIIVTSSGVDAGVTTALDASAAFITNALSIGANNILSTGTVTFSRATAGIVTLAPADDTGAADITLDALLTGAIIIGSVDVTSIALTTDANAAADINITGGVTISTDLVITGGDINASGEASTFTIIDNTASAFVLESVTDGLDYIAITTTNDAETMVFGHSTVDSVTVTTDGTGTAEVALPAGSIDGTEILDDTIAAADLSATLTFADADFINLAAILHDDTAVQGLRLPNVGGSPADPTGAGEGYIAWNETDNQLLVNTGAAWSVVGPGTSTNNTWTGTNTYETDVNLTFLGTENLAITNDASATVDVISLAITPSGTAGTIQGIKIDNVDSANANGIDTGIEIDNSDITGSDMTDGILFTSAGGVITNAINAVDTDIVNAISVGTNVIAITTGTIGSNDATVVDFVDFDVSADGLTVLAPDGTGVALTLTLPAADTQGILINAASAVNASLLGLIDLNIATATDGFEGINMDLQVDDDAGADTVMGIYLNIDDNATTANDTVYGLYIEAEVAGSADADLVPTALIYLDNSNTDATDVLPDAIFVNDDGGTITNALNASDAGIVNAINVGDNVILGLAAVINFTGFDVAATTGATVIAGSAAGTAALTLSLGDLVLVDTDTTTITSVNGTTSVVLIDNAGGVQADNTSALLIDAGGNNASGSNMLRLAPTGTPVEGSIGIEFVGSTKVMQAMNIDGDSVSNSVVVLNGGGALADNKAVLEVTADGTMVAGSSLVRIASTTAAGGATVYGLEIAANAANLEGLWVSAGLSVFAENVTISAGGVTLTAGDVVISSGKLTADTTADETSYIKRNHATSTAAVAEVEQTHTGATGSGLLIDQNATGNAIGLEITHDGDLAALNIVASAVRTGNVINIPMANQLAETALDITGVATGTSGEGIIHVDVTGVLAGNAIRVDSTGANAATGQLIYATSSGQQASATNGIAGYFEDTGAARATSYTVYIASTNNEALRVDTGVVQFDEALTLGVDDTGADLLAYGATASAQLLWDESDDDLELNGVAGFTEAAQSLTPDSNSDSASSIPSGKRAATVGAVTLNADDWIVLPAIADVPIGHTIRIAANAGGNFEMRTPAASNTTINNVDSDGTAEYLVTNTDLVVVTKHTATGWIAVSYTNLGAVRAAVVPD